MKTILLSAVLVMLILMLGACGEDSPSVDIEANVEAAVEATLESMPAELAPPEPSSADLVEATSTPEPVTVADNPRERLYRSYPEPTGIAGFRVYYQKRCYPGCHSYDGESSEPIAVSDSGRERLYRSYPEPTGIAGFRVYYQKRCYPGCHSYGTPEPDVVHP